MSGNSGESNRSVNQPAGREIDEGYLAWMKWKTNGKPFPIEIPDDSEGEEGEGSDSVMSIHSVVADNREFLPGKQKQELEKEKRSRKKTQAGVERVESSMIQQLLQKIDDDEAGSSMPPKRHSERRRFNPSK